MPKKKLFNGSNYVGAPVSDKIYVALWKNSIYKGMSIADVIRRVLRSWEESEYSKIPETEIAAIEKIMAQRKSK